MVAAQVNDYRTSMHAFACCRTVGHLAYRPVPHTLTCMLSMASVFGSPVKCCSIHACGKRIGLNDTVRNAHKLCVPMGVRLVGSSMWS